MRTTLDIADDVLQAVKERARREKRTAGAIISELARIGLAAFPDSELVRQPRALSGFRPFPKRGGVVTDTNVKKLREDDAI